MQKTRSHLLILWVLLMIPVVSANGQNILVLQLPDPCLSTGAIITQIQISHPFQFSITPNPAKEENQLNIYPNPTSGIFHVEIPEGTNPASLNVFDTSGRLILY